MADSAFHFHADDFELSFGSQHGRKRPERFVHRVELRATLAADGEDDLFHSNENQRADCNGTLLEFSLRIREAEENSGGIFSRSSSSLDEQWSGLSESNRHLNLGKVDRERQKRWIWRLFSDLDGGSDGKQLENES